MKDQLILDTAKLSLLIQALTGIVGIQGLMTDIPEKHHILKDILALETVVQFIEFAYYIWLIYCFKQLTYDITFTRYFDWFLSTPIMLVSTILFLEYNTKYLHCFICGVFLFALGFASRFVCVLEHALSIFGFGYVLQYLLQ